MIIILPVLNAFEFPINRIGFGEFLLIIVMIIGIPKVWNHFIDRKRGIAFNKDHVFKAWALHHMHIIFLVYSILISVAAYYFTPSYSLVEVLGRLARQLLYGFILIVYTPLFFRPRKAVRYYGIVIALALIYLILQLIFHKFGYSFYPNFIPSKLLYTIQDSMDFRYHLNINSLIQYRPTSFFLEPAYYGEYVVPFIAIVLFNEDKGIKEWILIALVIFSVLLTKSANGFVFLGVVLLAYSVHILLTLKMKYKWYYTAILFLIGANILAVLYFMDNPYLVGILNRFGEIGVGKGNTSGNIRILRGFLVFAALGGAFKMFGFGFGNYEAFRNDYRLITDMDHYVDNSDYMSGFTQILTSAGLIGSVLFLWMILRYSVRGGLKTMSLGILLMVMMISSSFYATPVYLLIISFMISIGEESVTTKAERSFL